MLWCCDLGSVYWYGKHPVRSLVSQRNVGGSESSDYCHLWGTVHAGWQGLSVCLSVCLSSSSYHLDLLWRPPSAAQRRDDGHSLLWIGVDYCLSVCLSVCLSLCVSVWWWTIVDWSGLLQRCDVLHGPCVCRLLTKSVTLHHSSLTHRWQSTDDGTAACVRCCLQTTMTTQVISILWRSLLTLSVIWTSMSHVCFKSDQLSMYERCNAPIIRPESYGDGTLML